jgi:hypothetical protein
LTEKITKLLEEALFMIAEEFCGNITEEEHYSSKQFDYKF